MIEMATEFMQTRIDVLGPSFEGECEVRQIVDSPHAEASRGGSEYAASAEVTGRA